jgi:hypothetical protein
LLLVAVVVVMVLVAVEVQEELFLQPLQVLQLEIHIP